MVFIYGGRWDWIALETIAMTGTDRRSTMYGTEIPKNNGPSGIR
jgi:hypothetical protein